MPKDYQRAAHALQEAEAMGRWATMPNGGLQANKNDAARVSGN
jgi:hypothetical protein